MRPPHPLDLQTQGQAYVERVNPAILSLLAEHVFPGATSPRVLDVGCGCGANAREVKARWPGAYVVGVEPDARGAERAAAVCDDVYRGSAEQWLAAGADATFDVVLLSDVLEHVADPIAFLRALAAAPGLQAARWVISVPNYGVWYNRARTLLGRQAYAWSGLWDRGHLRFFTRGSIRELLVYAGFELLEEASTPSLVQSTAPVVRWALGQRRRVAEPTVLADVAAYGVYQRAIEPVERRLCDAWPELLAFQIVHLARVADARR